VSPLVVLFAPAVLVIEYPLAALVPAAAFGLLRRRYPRRVLTVAAVSWLLYAAWESAMKARWRAGGAEDATA